MTTVKLKIKRLNRLAYVPKYATDGAACFDLHAIMEDGVEYVYVGKGSSAILRTGLAVEVPTGHVLLIYSRSGHGFKQNVRLSNCVGVIDSDYRGELMAKLVRDEDSGPAMIVRHGDRIAQAMLVPIPQVELELVEELSDTVRGENGCGSTGQAA